MRGLLAAVMAAVLLGSAGSAFAAQGPGNSDHKCAPGQHGNPHPGFKPGVCNNK